MQGIFVELPAFQRLREHYLNDDAYRLLQDELKKSPVAGDVIADTGGLRKIRFGDSRRGKGKRGGLRVIYYWWLGGRQFWLFTLYDKNEVQDLNAKQCKRLSEMLHLEIEARTK